LRCFLHLDEKNPPFSHSPTKDLFSQILTGIPLFSLTNACQVINLGQVALSGTFWRAVALIFTQILTTKQVNFKTAISQIIHFLFPSHCSFLFVVFSVTPYCLPDSHLDSIVGFRRCFEGI